MNSTFKNNGLVSTVAALALLSGTVSAVDSPPNLARYYIHYKMPDHPAVDPYGAVTAYSPQVKVVGGGNDPPTFGANLSVDRLIRLYTINVDVSGAAPRGDIGFFHPINGGACRIEATSIKSSVFEGQEVLERNQWRSTIPEGCGPDFFIGPGPVKWTVDDRISFGVVQRRNALDGGRYEASPMTLLRDGQAWATYHWGYRLGLVASVANWDAANLSKVPALATWPSFPDAKDNFELATLPPPWIEDDIIEYVNRADFPAQPGGQYFYAVRAEDKTLLDSIPVWQRTGKSFKSGGYVSACRFYGGKNGGPNTHFYSADDKECAALKAIPQLSYEGQTFAVNVPLPGAAVDGVKPCPVASKPLYRVYNNASKSSGRFVSNHRYLTEKADVAAVVAQGWADEGQVMCVPQ
jgi:hypothetical protein